MSAFPAIRDRGSYRATVHLLAGAQKKAAPGSPPYSVYVNRPVGRYAAAGAHLLGLGPNAVSAISSAFTLAGIVSIALLAPRWWTGLLVWALLALGYVLDSADGQVARLRGGGSLAGEWLDHVLDSLKIPALHLAVLIAAYRSFDLPSAALLLVPIAYTVVATVSFFAMILNDQLRTTAALRAGAPAAPVRPRNASLPRSILLLPTDYGLLCLVFVFLGAPRVFFTLYTLFFVANAAHLLLASFTWFHSMKSLDPH
ncbi:MAG: CDP-alcohol phosphatidyltransferase family protein [Specibacter sp.]